MRISADLFSKTCLPEINDDFPEIDHKILGASYFGPNMATSHELTVTAPSYAEVYRKANGEKNRKSIFKKLKKKNCEFHILANDIMFHR